MEKDSAKILVVDDVNSVRLQMKDLLHRAGFIHVITLNSGENAKIALENSLFHLVLCDWFLANELTGLDLLKMIRNHSNLQNTAFIMVSGENTVEKVTEAIITGVDDYIVKPLTMEHILTRVKKAISKRWG